ncbi:hypothetical protein [Sphingomonas sp. 3-13AW]|uniref:hypothetical protein n=1 Tax=Sphingomonas sp. 3-13AW TaxID=3050450 RepID=UPI003BB79025
MLKVQFGELLSLVGGIEIAARFCRVGKSTLARYASLSFADAECFAPVDVVRDLEALAGVPRVTRHLSIEAGGMFMPVPERFGGRATLLELVARKGKESAELTAAICAGLADGKFDAADARKALPELDDILGVLATMRGELLAISEEEA